MHIGSTLIPLLSALVSTIFAGLVLRRYWLGRQSTHLLFWGIGMILYAIGGYSEAWYGAWGYNHVIYKLWYLSGAILTAAWLGQGTVFLLWKERRWARISAKILIGVSFLAAGLIMETHPDPSLLMTTEMTGAALPKYVRLLTPFLNSYGTLFLVGGAIYSAWIFYRKRVLLHRTIGNVLIATGALAPALGGLLNRLTTIPFALYIGELIGSILMFIGFLRAITPFKSESEANESIPQTT
jgi:hypothetical protein